MNYKIEKIYLIFIFIFFSIILILNFNLNIFDYDDGYTIAYHCWGRNPILQGPYNPYDSLSDLALSILPQNYKVIFLIMILATSLSCISALFLLFKFIKLFINLNEKQYLLYSILVLLAVPEWFYLSLSFKSSIIGFQFLILSHLLIVKSGKLNNVRILLSAIVFAIGSACRWNLIIYGLVIWFDLFYLIYFKIHLNVF